MRLKKCKKSLLRFVVMLSIICIISSCFIFSANAATAYNMPIATPTADQFSGYLEVLLLDTSGTTYRVATYSWRLSYSFCIDDYEYDSDLMSSYLEVDTSYVPMFNLDILVRSNTISFITTLEGSSLSIYDIRMSHTYAMSTGYHTYRYFNPSSSNTTTINGSFYVPEQFNIVGYKIYGNGIINSSSILKEQNANWYAVYTENSQQGITDSIDKNTDKIINGGHDEPAYDSPDSTVKDEYEQKEQEILDQTEEGREETKTIIGNLGSLTEHNKIGKGLLFVSAVFKEYLNISWLNDILVFSLALGTVAFLLGVGHIIVGSISKDDSIDTSNWSSNDERWLM